MFYRTKINIKSLGVVGRSRFMFLRQGMPYILNIKRKTMMCEHVGISLVLLFHGFKIPDPKL